MSNQALQVPQKTCSPAWRPTWLPTVVTALLTSCVFPLSAAPVGQAIPNSTPRFVKTAKSLGPANPAEIMEVSIWLTPRNRDVMDSLAEELYDPSSPHYRQWLTRDEIAAKFAPTAAQVRTVEEFLSSHNLPVVNVGPHNFVVRARGALGDVQKAFHVDISTFEVNGKTYRANTNDPYLEGPAAELTEAVSGLDNMEFQHPAVKRMLKNQTSKPISKLNSASANGDGSSSGVSDAAPAFFSPRCFTGTKTEYWTGSEGFPEGIYTGNGYAAGSSLGCGYTPPEIWKAYNLNPLYKEGFDGTGQTIVIIDWCGSLTIKQDANAFSAKFGLPPLTSSNFEEIDYPEPSTCAGPDPEINIDVEWAHAIAPGAKIALVVPPTASFEDVDTAQLYAVANRLGNVLSGSYGSEELYDSPAELNIENSLNELAAIEGISANFSTGDDGDFTFDFPQYYPASVSAPADSPFATGVGGVTLALKIDGTIDWQTGWGNNQTGLVEPVNGYVTVFNPPDNFGFVFGSGGGASGVFPKPSFQKKLPGKDRLLPDISWLADPYTGGVIAISYPFQYPPTVYEVYGGTSLACPMFSALWAIANQEAGAPLGQAARHLYSLPAGAIYDVLPIASKTNVTATIYDLSGEYDYTAAELAAPLEGNTKFYSAIWDYPGEEDTVVLLTFGTDSGLKTTTGWDNVTGLGTPNGKTFADAFNPAK